jgi:hypothetical protein
MNSVTTDRHGRQGCTALSEQLGLRLETRKGPVRVYVIEKTKSQERTEESEARFTLAGKLSLQGLSRSSRQRQLPSQRDPVCFRDRSCVVGLVLGWV